MKPIPQNRRPIPLDDSTQSGYIIGNLIKIILEDTKRGPLEKWVEENSSDFLSGVDYLVEGCINIINREGLLYRINRADLFILVLGDIYSYLYTYMIKTGYKPYADNKNKKIVFKKK